MDLTKLLADADMLPASFFRSASSSDSTKKLSPGYILSHGYLTLFLARGGGTFLLDLEFGHRFSPRSGVVASNRASNQSAGHTSGTSPALWTTKDRGSPDDEGAADVGKRGEAGYGLRGGPFLGTLRPYVSLIRYSGDGSFRRSLGIDLRNTPNSRAKVEAYDQSRDGSRVLTRLSPRTKGLPHAKA